MKVAISGKGGVGKTLLAALLYQTFVDSGYSLLVLDADPDSNLAATLGFPQAKEIMPVFDSSQKAKAALKDIYQALISTEKLAIK